MDTHNQTSSLEFRDFPIELEEGREVQACPVLLYMDILRCRKLQCKLFIDQSTADKSRMFLFPYEVHLRNAINELDSYIPQDCPRGLSIDSQSSSL